ncbi:RNA polymerase sigma factor [Runella aurantiaca]|nr:hypothetical protein [Runella aurantiaca]
MKNFDLLKIKEGYEAEIGIRKEVVQTITAIAERAKAKAEVDFAKENLLRLAKAAANVFIWLIRKNKVLEASEELLELLFREQIVIDRTAVLDERKANDYFSKLNPLLHKIVERRTGIRDKAVVENIVQETNKRFFSNVKTKGVELTTRLEGYWYGIAKNIIREQDREAWKNKKTREYKPDEMLHNRSQKPTSVSNLYSDNHINYVVEVNHVVAKHFTKLPEKCQKSFLLGYGWDADKIAKIAHKRLLNHEERLNWIEKIEVSSNTSKPLTYEQYYEEVRAKTAIAAKTAHSRCLNDLSEKAIPELIEVVERYGIPWKSLEEELKSRLKKSRKDERDGKNR